MVKLASPIDLSPPQRLPASAAETWRAVVGTMARAGTLDAAVLPAVERYCTLIARWRAAEAAIAAEGVVIEAPRSKVRSVNPWISISRNTAAQAAKLEAELGLTPARRGSARQAAPGGRLQADGTPAPLTAWENHLARVETGKR
jgi:P27 family predicted phage terminase small subunit